LFEFLSASSQGTGTLRYAVEGQRNVALYDRARREPSCSGWPMLATYLPKSLRNRLVYCSGVPVLTELHVGEAVLWLHGVSRSSDQK
jgi:hypothetical protein